MIVSVSIHHYLAVMRRSQASKAKSKWRLLSAIRVNPDIQSTCVSCQMQRRWRVWSMVYGEKGIRRKRLATDGLSSRPHIFGVCALGNNRQPFIGLLRDSHCGKCQGLANFTGPAFDLNPVAGGRRR